MESVIVYLFRGIRVFYRDYIEHNGRQNGNYEKCFGSCTAHRGSCRLQAQQASS